MKLKHKFRVHHLLDCYPTSEDALFDIINFLKDHDINIESEWSDLGIKGAFLKKISEEDIESLLQELVSNDFLSMRAGSGKRNYYTIKNNPF
jgi:hypothetical protein